jgi:hypothetical protein
MRYFDTIAEQQRGPFKIIVDKTWEDISPRDCFDESVTDLDELCEKIDAGYYDWFMLRTRVYFEGVELAAEYLGGCLYESADEVLNDGTAEDQIYQALLNAKAAAADMKKKFAALDENLVDSLVA